jgi:hypothetical protein
MLLDEREIRLCILRYCHGTDRLDWQLVVDCYVPGATDDHGSFNGPVEKITDWLAGYQDQWRIASRTVLVGWSRNLGRPVPWSAPAAAALTPGRQDGQDVAQLAFAEMARLRSNLKEKAPA